MNKEALSTRREYPIGPIWSALDPVVDRAPLSGHAIRTPRALWLADHTYVKAGLIPVGCFGRCRGGRRINEGRGDFLWAMAIAGPDGTAALEYAVIGVCHQAANRVLFPAGEFVSGARGYRLSVRRWGIYGSEPWNPFAPLENAIRPWLSEVAAGLREAAAKFTIDRNAEREYGSVTPVRSSPDPPMEPATEERKQAEYDRRIKDLFRDGMPGSWIEQHQRELELMFDVFLGTDFDKDKEEEVLKLHREHDEVCEELKEKLHNKTLDKETYLRESEKIDKQVVDATFVILGKKNFEVLFGERKWLARTLVDRGKFLRSPKQ